MLRKTMNCGRGRRPSNISISDWLNSGPCASLSMSFIIASQCDQGVLSAYLSVLVRVGHPRRHQELRHLKMIRVRQWATSAHVGLQVGWKPMFIRNWGACCRLRKILDIKAFVATHANTPRRGWVGRIVLGRCMRGQRFRYRGQSIVLDLLDCNFSPFAGRNTINPALLLLGVVYRAARCKVVGRSRTHYALIVGHYLDSLTH
ncbi:hypothetical protein RSOLAG1IB_12129 [Rhizoctonia solani AG-1 IB]|uniref:Uncharacterized protein n=1 Tax=Thanatephorus cucumeris (strain AG1-IB / isolate 7/3/14) TaxID=1108050 RepID=A0A0B7FKE9_THACB|nr:hypothetical protein RSOLAG1IB_12129 [Rhizoctonia solani AG-1 IB]